MAHAEGNYFAIDAKVLFVPVRYTGYGRAVLCNLKIISGIYLSVRFADRYILTVSETMTGLVSSSRLDLYQS